ncbi:YaaA family protein [Microbacterium gorillae]|uniref:YaaA family protein n=1 Tax=Microbacterium gorillae TaxID=1231063 RepID=UPI003D95CE09
MLVLLPPSETKHPGGSGAPLDPAALAFGELLPQRERTIEALVSLSSDVDEAARVLKLSERQRGDIAVNAALRAAPTLPAVDRYTGVLFDALAASDLDRPARRWLGEHVMIHSAPFGPVGALDRIPAYRLAAGTSIPSLGALKRLWAPAVSAAISAHAPAFVLDLRSEAYASLGPIPDDVASAYVRVVTAGEDGTVRALNHFNKHAKGELVRRLAQERPRIRSRAGLLRWADDAGVVLRERGAELDLVV